MFGKQIQRNRKIVIFGLADSICRHRPTFDDALPGLPRILTPPVWGRSYGQFFPAVACDNLSTRADYQTNARESISGELWVSVEVHLDGKRNVRGQGSTRRGESRQGAVAPVTILQDKADQSACRLSGTVSPAPPRWER